MLAETDDDLSIMTLPTEGSAPTSSPHENRQSSNITSNSPESQAKVSSSRKVIDSFHESLNHPPPATSSGKRQNQLYPLYPSITQLLYENQISRSEADKIPASGPKGRLLKGDVLGYLGRISSTYSSEQSKRISKLGRLDLGNIEPAVFKNMAPSQPGTYQTPKAPEPVLVSTDTDITIPISLSAVISVQRRIQATLGITLPLSTFIARATELANRDLPRSAATLSTADELFNDVLGLDNISLKTSRGSYAPHIAALPSKPCTESAGPQRQPDVYEVLTGTSPTRTTLIDTVMRPADMMAFSKAEESTSKTESTNVFSVSAVKGDERRAKVFLERIKTILQVEPGSLVL